jgi:hypothetical protein
MIIIIIIGHDERRFCWMDVFCLLLCPLLFLALLNLLCSLICILISVINKLIILQFILLKMEKNGKRGLFYKNFMSKNNQILAIIRCYGLGLGVKHGLRLGLGRIGILKSSYMA